MRRRSTPAENAAPAPVTTTASADATSRIVALIARSSSRSSAFTLPCSSCTTATLSCWATWITAYSPDAGRPVGGAELAGDAARCLAHRVACRRIDRPGAGRHHDADRADSAIRRIEHGRRDRALADQRLFLFDRDAVLAHCLQLRGQLVFGRDRRASHAAQTSARRRSSVTDLEGEDRFPQGTRMSRDDDAHLRHLPAAVRTRLVMNDDDVVEQQDPGAHREPGAPSQVLGPRDRLRAQLDRVEVDVAEPEHGRAQLVAAPPAALTHQTGE